ncbi:MFS transporter [Nonomuraea endophytica]|uniref:Putative MFS family arabinose efflux permease n=1 Tax=Nonomuraea endophytica TaxID=714136 RepID=A0A7W8A9C5_9ACTN|nr:MFS transporter [Nonomuraea endophytica]MBB5082036.1 putative MFS family arabinose efflux permease [Nonomuraea endophytica]
MRLYPVLAVGMLAITDAFVNQALSVLAPDMTSSLGVSASALATLLAIQLLAVGAAPFLMAALVGGRPRRAVISIVTGFVWSLSTIAMAFADSVWMVGVLLVLSGLANGSQLALHSPLLADLYEPAVRGRVLALYGAATPAGAILSPLTVSALAGWLDLDWRTVFVVLGTVSMLGCLFALRLRDPGIGRFEVPEGGGGLLRSRTLRRVFACFVAFGMLLVPAATFLSVHLKERWGLETEARGIFTAICSAATIVVLVTLGRRLDGLFTSDPRRVPYVIAVLLVCCGGAFALGVNAPNVVLCLIAFFVGLMLTPLILPLITLIMVSVTAPAQRTYTASFFGISLAVGGLAGAWLIGSGGARGMAIPALVAGLIIASAARTIQHDLVPVKKENLSV